LGWQLKQRVEAKTNRIRFSAPVPLGEWQETQGTAK